MNIFPIGNGFNQAKLTASVKQLHPLYFMRGVQNIYLSIKCKHVSALGWTFLIEWFKALKQIRKKKKTQKAKNCKRLVKRTLQAFNR